MAPEEARRQAILKFGNVALVKEDMRAIWGWPRLEQLAQDSCYAVRILRRRPVYALLSVLTLALGIGGTAAVFGVAHGVLLSPLPYAHERELGVLAEIAYNGSAGPQLGSRAARTRHRRRRNRPTVRSHRVLREGLVKRTSPRPRFHSSSIW